MRSQSHLSETESDTALYYTPSLRSKNTDRQTLTLKNMLNHTITLLTRNNTAQAETSSLYGNDDTVPITDWLTHVLPVLMKYFM